MITVTEATSIIQEKLHRPLVEEVDIHESVGRVLAATIKADRDLPPFTRVTMDGIAINFTAFKNGMREFVIEGVQAAGQPALTLASPSKGCIEVMTGAMLPAGTDTVIRYEDVTVDQGKASIQTEEVELRQSLHHQGQDAKRDSTLLEPGVRLAAAETALLASVGVTRVKVFQLQPIAIVSTGNELVDIGATPQLWEIRKSNASALAAALRQMDIPSKLFHLRDNADQLRRELEGILRDHPIVILSGGVSKGKFDFVPDVLSQLGVNKKFHQVAQRPGKPFWFGRSEHHTVFALPGNPVSTFLCFYKYIRPWLERSLQLQPYQLQAILAHDFEFAPPLTYFLQVKVSNDNGRLMATPDPGGGSGDFANLKEVDGFLELPKERSAFKKGDVLPYIPFR